MAKSNVAVIGAGKMGLGIAQAFAAKGFQVMLVSLFDDKLRGDALECISGNLNILCDHGVICAAQVPDILGRVTVVEEIEAVGSFANIVFECVVENLDIKQEFFKNLDAFCSEEIILATNTSALSVTQIAEKSIRRERIIGTHFWNPPYLIPLVEIIKTDCVADWVVEKTHAILVEAGKKPVLVKKDVPGFIGNRMQHALFREALSIMEKGIADPEDIDNAIKYGFGMRMGIAAPMEVMDMGGMDLTYAIHSYLFPHLENAAEPLDIEKEKIEKGELGFKTGKGLFSWSAEDMETANRNLTAGLIKVAQALGRI